MANSRGWNAKARAYSRRFACRLQYRITLSGNARDDKSRRRLIPASACCSGLRNLIEAGCKLHIARRSVCVTRVRQASGWTRRWTDGRATFVVDYWFSILFRARFPKARVRVTVFSPKIVGHVRPHVSSVCRHTFARSIKGIKLGSYGVGGNIVWRATPGIIYTTRARTLEFSCLRTDCPFNLSSYPGVSHVSTI